MRMTHTLTDNIKCQEKEGKAMDGEESKWNIQEEENNNISNYRETQIVVNKHQTNVRRSYNTFGKTSSTKLSKNYTHLAEKS